MSDFLIIVPLASRSHSNVLPFGPLYLAESLLNSGFSVKILDGTVEEILGSIHQSVDRDTIAFGISSFSGTQLKHAIHIAKELKRVYPQIPVVFGGVHTTALPHQTLAAEFIDYIVYGEGEVSLPRLLNAIKKQSDVSAIKGIGYKRDKKCFTTENSGFTSLDRQFDFPYHLLDMTKYSRGLIVGPKRNYYIMTSRGCPFGCKFCSNSSAVWPNMKMRYHTIDHVIHDIQTLVENHHADGITFADEIFFVDRTRVVEICRALIKNNLNKKVKFRASGRADILAKMPQFVWETLKEAGFIAMGVGIESGSQRILDFIGKGITLDQIYRTDALLNAYKFYKSYNFMTCIPGENIEDLNETLSVIIELARTSKDSPYPFSTLHKFIPLPGTELYQMAVEKYGFKPPQDIEDWVYFDFENVVETIEKVRPWLSRGLLGYVNAANQRIEELNALFIGPGSEDAKIEAQIKKIEELISSSRDKHPSAKEFPPAHTYLPKGDMVKPVRGTP